MGNDESNGDASARIISERRNSNPTPPTSKEDFSLPKLVRNRTWSSSVGEKKLLKKNPSGSSLSISSGGQSVSPESSSSVSWGRFGFKEKKISVIVSKPSNSTYMVSPRRHRSTPYSLSMTDLLSNPSPPVTIEIRSKWPHHPSILPPTHTHPHNTTPQTHSTHTHSQHMQHNIALTHATSSYGG